MSSGTHYLRLQSKDNAGNLADWATLFTFRYTTGNSPILQDFSLSLESGAQNLHILGTTLYYGPLSSGSIRVGVSTGESGQALPIGLDWLDFPDVFTADDGQ